MTYIHSPELGMAISVAGEAIGVYAAAKMVQERWAHPNRFNDAQYRASWNKQIFPLAVWLFACFVGFAMYFHDYIN
jgi:hypothetical protein